MTVRDVIQDVVGDVIGDVTGGLVVPPILATALVWFDETTLVVSGSDVTGWTNKGTGGPTYDLTGFTSALILPQLNAVNGVDVVDFNVVPDRSWFVPAAGIEITQPYTVVVVSQQDTLPLAQHVIFDGIAAGNRAFIQSISTDNQIQAFSGNVLNAGINSSTLLASIKTFVANNVGNDRIKISDISDVSGNAGIGSWTYCTLGANLNTFNGTDGWVHAFIVFNSALITQEIVDIENYYKSKLGI